MLRSWARNRNRASIDVFEWQYTTTAVYAQRQRRELDAFDIIIHVGQKSEELCLIAYIFTILRLISTIWRITGALCSEFKYLGHIISNNEHDDNDVLREVRAMFTRTNILARRFSSCSVSVKTVLFRSYCICFYGMELWKCYSSSTVNRLRSCYIKCMKLFFNYSKYYSVTDVDQTATTKFRYSNMCAILRHF